MSISSKGRRKIIVGGQTYLWYVALDDDSPYDILHVVSDDKYLIFDCPLKTAREYVISKGRRFQAKDTNGLWNRYLLPFHIPESITPKFVEQLILWSTQDSGAMPIDGDFSV
ncbi:MAG: hypothetical protein E7494_06820 [Ruminococcus albus]|nr:hypothetical protein [Ruminococcus albus]